MDKTDYKIFGALALVFGVLLFIGSILIASSYYALRDSVTGLFILGFVLSFVGALLLFKARED